MKLPALLAAAAATAAALPQASSSSSSPSSSSSSSSASSSSSSSSDGSDAACAKIATSFAQAARANKTNTFSIAGADAHSCLRSMPYDRDRARQFLTELRRYVEFQSTLEALRRPPGSYRSSAVDVLGGLDSIAAKGDTYASQYDFDADVSALVRSANDGHFAVALCSLGVFQFARQPYTLVSVSRDGLALPELYTQHDAALLNNNNNDDEGGDNGGGVSPVAAINGQDPQEYLAGVTRYLYSQDPDARYNTLFPSKAAVANSPSSAQAGFGTFILNSGLWPGVDATSLQFRNGSVKEIETIALLNAAGFNATSGRDLLASACLPKAAPQGKNGTSPGGDASQQQYRPPFESGPDGYPEPQIRDPYNQIIGYYLDGGDQRDTAVLFVPSFDGEGLPPNQSRIFADVATRFVDQAARDGRTKLIIDVSANGGGVITRAFDLFKLFFPDKFPYSATRFRKHTGVESLVSIFGALNMSIAQQQGPLGWAGQVKPDQTTGFASLDEFLGGNQTQLDTRVSSLYANYNFTFQALDGGAGTLRGYGNDTRLPSTGPFKAENIVIVGDGVCASTCTTFTNLMTNVGGVRTLVFGGRPRPGPMQIMGGVRGAQSVAFSTIDEWVSQATQVVANVPNGTFSAQLLSTANASVPRGLGNMPLVLAGGNVNFRNAYQQGDDDLPLQFAYQAADCRLFYTADNYARPNTTWSAARDAIWGAKGCVKESTGGQGSRGNNGTSGGTSGGDSAGRSAGSTTTIAWGLMAACVSAVLML